MFMIQNEIGTVKSFFIKTPGLNRKPVAEKCLDPDPDSVNPDLKHTVAPLPPLSFWLLSEND